MADADNKEGVKNEAKTITIRIKAQSGEETYFKVKGTTLMGKIFKAYASRQGLDVNTMRFMLDGHRINAEQTPDELELEDQDQIDMQMAQVGGGRF